MRHPDIYRRPKLSFGRKVVLRIKKRLNYGGGRPARKPNAAAASFRHPAWQPRLLERIPKARILFVGAGLVLVFSLSGYLLLARGEDENPIDDSLIAGPLSPDQLERGTPGYPVLTPQGEDIDDKGGWVRISPDDRDPVYAFVDSIGKVDISVSQQPLPEEFRKDTAQSIERLARDFGATEKVTSNGTAIYIGSTVEGPQSVILSRDGLLILIKSTDRIPSRQWSDYVAALK